MITKAARWSCIVPSKPVSCLPRRLYATSIRSACRSGSHNAARLIALGSHRPVILGGSWTSVTACRITRRPLYGDAIAFLHSNVPTILFPPLLFVGLVMALWLQKCVMLVIFQSKLIYMPSMPPFSRSEKLENYERICKPAVWEEQSIKSLDGTRIALCIGRLENTAVRHAKRRIVVLYFQGNGSSTPPRTPMLSKALASFRDCPDVDVTFVAVSYRGYWTSAGRPSQRGIEKDAQAFLEWARQTYGNTDIILWGQSIGAGIATQAAATHLCNNLADKLNVVGLILETPFVSIKRMLAALYPEKWVPYRYLWPFLRSWWDSEQALTIIAKSHVPPEILLMPAGKDEIVPAQEADYLEELCGKLGLPYQRRDVLGALHNEASSRAGGRRAIMDFILNKSRL